MTKRVMWQTETAACVKVYGTNSTDTISLATDLLSSTMTVSGSPTVNITAVTWYSDDIGQGVTVTRNSVPILNLPSVGQLLLSPQFGITEDTQNTSDLVVTLSGTGGCYLTLRKVAGYASKIETYKFGQYDNVNAVGS